MAFTYFFLMFGVGCAGAILGLIFHTHHGRYVSFSPTIKISAFSATCGLGASLFATKWLNPHVFVSMDTMIEQGVSLWMMGVLIACLISFAVSCLFGTIIFGFHIRDRRRHSMAVLRDW